VSTIDALGCPRVPAADAAQRPRPNSACGKTGRSEKARIVSYGGRCAPCDGRMSISKAICDRAQRVAGAHHDDQGGRLRHVPMTSRAGRGTARASASGVARACFVAPTAHHRRPMRWWSDCREPPSGERAEQRAAHPSAHVLFASRDARRAGACVQELRGTATSARRGRTCT
jgi:hypothetical protein